VSAPSPMEGTRHAPGGHRNDDTDTREIFLEFSWIPDLSNQASEPSNASAMACAIVFSRLLRPGDRNVDSSNPWRTAATSRLSVSSRAVV